MRPERSQSGMTIDEFVAFTATRPHEERWELVEGVAVMSPSPTDYHQIIQRNISTLLHLQQRKSQATWLPMPGISMQVPISPSSFPQPDFMVKEGRPTGSDKTAEALVLFEILSRSNSRADQAWRKRVYASVPNLQHYVTIAQKRALVTRFDRESGWKSVLWNL